MEQVSQVTFMVGPARDRDWNTAVATRSDPPVRAKNLGKGSNFGKLHRKALNEYKTFRDLARQGRLKYTTRNYRHHDRPHSAYGLMLGCLYVSFVPELRTFISKHRLDFEELTQVLFIVRDAFTYNEPYGRQHITVLKVERK